ncbi:hemerythrin domain-containing protein [Psychrobacter sp. FDAARGOS_221]|uniref:hemerythrin domain-containing protein n=1 Tax=Psychrobacter sp. FDAARGOS_221 TaxID=1975705 RepID=UPI000BB544B3|nr:hemerythrin domain-containing protein [Psychrobacter sp. FDAARGOS_221]PNK60079.1 hypothetical protein A6J60_003770 [Psychrobacter sp. FDAARGOS_221]
MKRIEQLQPLSREHHLGLVISNHAKQCANDVEQIAKHWTALTDYINHNMDNHFKVEDDLILTTLAQYQQQHPKVAEVMQKLTEQHSQLYQLVTLDSLSAAQVRELGTALYDHIRFEERELFPLVEQLFSEQQLQAVYEASSSNAKRIDENR